MSLLLGMPLLLFLALLPVMLAGVWAINRSGTEFTVGRMIMRMALYVLSLAVVTHLLFAVTYLYADGFRDHIEPNTAIISWLFVSGQDIYHRIDAAERYSFLYGPLAYMATGGLFAIFGASTFTAKIAGFVCLVLSFAGLTAAVTRIGEGRWMPVIVALGYCALLALFFKNHSFWSKPDPFMMAAISGGLFACMLRGKAFTWLLCGLCLGLAVNAKITGGVYFLPLLAWLFERDGFRAIVVTGAIALVISAMPFMAANISLQNYLSLLQAAGDHGISSRLLIENTLFVLLALVPVFSFLLYERHITGRCHILWQHKWVSVASVAALVLILIAASKPGSGPHHFLPFLPLGAAFTAFACRQVYVIASRPAADYFWAAMVAFLIATTIKTTVMVYYGLKVSAPAVGIQARTDLEQIQTDYAGKDIYMGYGDGTRYVTTFVRDQLAYNGNPYLLDAPAMMDFQFSGLDIPAATTDAMLADEQAVWLIPAGQEPFTIVNWHYRKQNGRLFDESFRNTFMINFRLDKSTQSFDVYTRK
ncbi:MAG: hypothetical protein ACR2QG_01985 [Gammaproteobacteria bacterium]